MDEFIELYKKGSIEGNTYIGYKFEVQRIKKYFKENTLIKDITTKKVQEFMNHLGTYLCKTTILKTKRMLNWIFERAVEDDIILKNPITKSVAVPKGVNIKNPEGCFDGEKIETYTAIELARMLKVFEEDVMRKPNGHSLIETAGRIQEVVAVRIQDIESKKNKI